MRTRLGPLRPIVDDDVWTGLGTLRLELRDAVDRGDNVLLLGAAGSGKTTALARLAADLQEDGQAAVLVRGQLARTLDDLIALIWDALPRPPAPAGGRPGPLPDMDAVLKAMARGPQPAIVSTAKQIESLRRPEPAVILLDDLTDTQVAEDLFARARDLLWDLGHQWVVAARPAQEAVLMRPPAGAFWNTRIHVPAPTGAELQELLAKRDLPPGRPASLPGSAGLRELLAAAANPPQTPPPGNQAAASPQLTAAERTLLDALAALGRPVPVSDEELLARVGWSKAYAASVMRSLAEGGLVVATPEQRATPGRPRKLYAVSSTDSPA